MYLSVVWPWLWLIGRGWFVCRSTPRLAVRFAGRVARYPIPRCPQSRYMVAEFQLSSSSSSATSVLPPLSEALCHSSFATSVLPPNVAAVPALPPCTLRTATAVGQRYNSGYTQLLGSAGIDPRRWHTMHPKTIHPARWHTIHPALVCSTRICSSSSGHSAQLSEPKELLNALQSIPHTWGESRICGTLFLETSFPSFHQR